MFKREEVINISACDNSVEKSAATQWFSPIFDIVSSYGRFSGARAPGPFECNRCAAMLAQYPPSIDASNAPYRGPRFTPPVDAATEGVALAGADVAQLIHLARAVLMKSPEDLAAIANAAPAMPANWVDVFTAERARAEAEAKFWSTAIAYLMATSPNSVANDG